MADETLTVELRTLAKLDGIKSAITGLKDVQKEGVKAQQGLSGAFAGFQKSLSGIPSSLANVAAGFLSIGAASRFLSTAFTEAIDAEKVLSQLTVALEATGEASAKNIQAFQDFAEAIQTSTRFSDDAVLQQIVLAKNFGLSNEAAQSLVKSATDLAAVTGNDLTSSTELFLKALSGQLPRELKLLGAEFANLTEEQLKAGKAKELFDSKFGGRAEQEINTLSGSIDKLKVSFLNLSESLGTGLLGGGQAAENVGFVASVIDNLKDGIDLLFKEKTKVEALSESLEGLDRAIRFNSRDDTTKGTLTRLQAQRDAVISELAAIQKQSQAAFGNGPLIPEEATKVEFKIDQGAVSKVLADLKNVGRSAIQIARQERDERLKILSEAFGGEDNINKLSVDNRKLYADAKLRIEKDLQTKITAEQDKASKAQADGLKNRLETFKRASQNLGQSFTEIFSSLKSGQGVSNELLGGTALGVGQAVTQGAAGGRTLLGAGAQVGGFALGGEAGGQVGAAVAPILQELSKGKEAAKAFVTEFLNSIPDMILGLVEGIGAAGQAFSEQIPVIIDRLIEGLPRVITSLAESMPRVAVALSIQMPLVAANFATSLIAEAPNIAKAIIKAVGNAPGQALGGIGKVFGFAEGGSFVQRVPAGQGAGTSERQLALLGSGELVVSQTLSNRLDNFLSNNDSATGAIENQQGNLMQMIESVINRPVIVNIDGREVFRAVRRQGRAGMVF
jgi:hypothetical protein